MLNYAYIDENEKHNYNICNIDKDCMNNSLSQRFNSVLYKPHKYNTIPISFLTNDNRINQSQINRLKTTPYKNGNKLINRKKELLIQAGDNTFEQRSTNVLSEAEINNNFPLIPEMITNLNNNNKIYSFSHIGINTRNLESDINYQKKCIKNIKKINKVNSNNKNIGNNK